MSSPGSMVATTTILLTRSATKMAAASASEQPGPRPRRGLDGGRDLRLGLLGQGALLDRAACRGLPRRPLST